MIATNNKIGMADNKLQSLTEIFNQRFFRIPDFQRGYSWGKVQLDDFWDDIQNLKSDKVHYIGLLTVEPISKAEVQKLEKWQDDLWLLEKGLSAYYVIDGQQRITTAIILINEILKLFDAKDGVNFDTKESWVDKFLYKEYKSAYKSFVFGYEKDNPSDEFFKTKILEQNSSSADKVPEQTLYTANLNQAKEYFSTKLKGISKEQLEDLFRKVTNKLKFNYYEIDDELDVYVTFETMNNRGKPLSNLELLKNRLIYLSTLLSEESDMRNRLRKDINEVWKTIYEYLGKNKNKPLDDDTFLYNHWIVYFKYDRSQSEAYANFLLSKKFTAQAVLKEKITLYDIKNYIDSLSKCVKAWYHIFNIQDSPYSFEIKEWMQKLERVGMSAFPPLFMVAFTKEKSGDQLLELLKAAEKFVFLVFRLTQRPSNTKNSHFYRLANLYYWESASEDKEEEINIDYVIDNIKWLTDGYYANGDYAGWFDLNNFARYIKDLSDKEEGYYSWNGLRYFLFEYELFLQEKANGNEKVSWRDFNKRKKENTIEHIYPQTPKEKCWKDAFANNDKKQRKALLHSLGNLLLLGSSKNSELQNYCFGYKKKHTNSKQDEVGYFNGSYSEIEVTSSANWTDKEIKNRGLRMLEFMEERWGFDITEWDELDKLTLLNLKFLE